MLARERRAIARQQECGFVVPLKQHGGFDQLLHNTRFGRVMQKLVTHGVKVLRIVWRQRRECVLRKTQLLAKQP